MQSLPITSNLENALHVAIQARKNAVHAVKNLVEEEMPIEALEHKIFYGQTALSFASIVGNKRAAVILVQKHPRLLYIRNQHTFLPVHVAAQYNHKDTFEYFLSVSEDEQGGVGPFAGKSGVHLVRQVIFSEYYDEALKLIDRYPELAKLQLPNGDSVLSAIALMESAFPSGSHLSFWENAIYSCVPMKLDEYAKERSRSDIEDPAQLLCKVKLLPSTTFQFGLLMMNLIMYSNWQFYMAGRLASPSKLNLIPGAALQMQCELQWFKEVEKLMRHQNKLTKNNHGEIPAMLFTEEHKDLEGEGEKWMKDAANSCTIVASLIATIAFAATINGPGGNDDSTGLPIFSKKKCIHHL
ncbi:uncharacterized protein LOC127805624 [Diospyros lotus]|uniref:uncharacterized protein LOC127805624 n=1 Tax=Diospyros lotus TaxID=55363 RepID=UPI0022547EC8|nr:uncharacterized protein LOC127805624 [Diospyros lotus]